MVDIVDVKLSSANVVVFFQRSIEFCFGNQFIYYQIRLYLIKIIFLNKL